METTTPFDLNQAIWQWRGKLAQSPAIHRENLDEMQAHLHDSIASLRQRGLSDEEAFMIAAKRVGDGPAVGREFEIIHPQSVWLERFFWMLAGWLAFEFVYGLFQSLTSNVLLLGFGWIETSHLLTPNNWLVGASCALIRLLTFAVVLLSCWYLFTRSGKRYADWMSKNFRFPIRVTMLGAGLLIVMLLARAFPMFGHVLLARSLPPNKFGSLLMGQSYGLAVSSTIELVVLVVLALWLARKRLLAKA